MGTCRSGSITRTDWSLLKQHLPDSVTPGSVTRKTDGLGAARTDIEPTTIRHAAAPSKQARLLKIANIFMCSISFDGCEREGSRRKRHAPYCRLYWRKHERREEDDTRWKRYFYFGNNRERKRRAGLTGLFLCHFFLSASYQGGKLRLVV